MLATQIFFYVHPDFLGKWSNLTFAYFSKGLSWNHQLDLCSLVNYHILRILLGSFHPDIHSIFLVGRIKLPFSGLRFVNHPSWFLEFEYLMRFVKSISLSRYIWICVWFCPFILSDSSFPWHFHFGFPGKENSGETCWRNEPPSVHGAWVF